MTINTHKQGRKIYYDCILLPNLIWIENVFSTSNNFHDVVDFQKRLGYLIFSMILKNLYLYTLSKASSTSTKDKCITKQFSTFLDEMIKHKLSMQVN